MDIAVRLQYFQARCVPEPLDAFAASRPCLAFELLPPVLLPQTSHEGWTRRATLPISVPGAGTPPSPVLPCLMPVPDFTYSRSGGFVPSPTKTTMEVLSVSKPSANLAMDVVCSSLPTSSAG